MNGNTRSPVLSMSDIKLIGRVLSIFFVVSMVFSILILFKSILLEGQYAKNGTKTPDSVHFIKYNDRGAITYISVLQKEQITTYSRVSILFFILSIVFMVPLLIYRKSYFKNLWFNTDITL